LISQFKPQSCFGNRALALIALDFTARFSKNVS